jgi:hypothetical protein
MLKKTIYIIAALLFGCSSNTGVQWLGGDFTQALDAAQEQNKPVLVDFYSDT